MKQTRKASLAESIANVVVGFGIAFVSQFVIFGFMGIPITAGENLVATLFFTVISIVRSFTLRRVFEVLRVRGLLP